MNSPVPFLSASPSVTYVSDWHHPASQSYELQSVSRTVCTKPFFLQLAQGTCIRCLGLPLCGKASRSVSAGQRDKHGGQPSSGTEIDTQVYKANDRTGIHVGASQAPENSSEVDAEMLAKFFQPCLACLGCLNQAHWVPNNPQFGFSQKETNRDGRS